MYRCAVRQYVHMSVVCTINSVYCVKFSRYILAFSEQIWQRRSN